MTVSGETKRRFALATALRGAFMLLAGLYAVIWPAEALTILVLAGGILLLIDGVLGLWSLTFGGGKSGNYWFDVVSNALSLLLGIVILISPLLATIFTVTFMATIVGIAALVVGVMQIVVITREREHYARIWPVVLSGASYVLLGLVFLFFPLLSASIGVIFGGVLLIMFSFGLFGWAWRLYQRSKGV
ncbi:MAG: HdeD family acid-resistance protein [Devosia sp.]